MVSLFKVGSPLPLIILETTPYEGASHLALGVPRLGVKRVFSVASNTIRLRLAVLRATVSQLNAPRKTGRHSETKKNGRTVCDMMAHTAQESTTLTHPAPVAGIPK